MTVHVRKQEEKSLQISLTIYELILLYTETNNKFNFTKCTKMEILQESNNSTEPEWLTHSPHKKPPPTRHQALMPSGHGMMEAWTSTPYAPMVSKKENMGKPKKASMAPSEMNDESQSTHMIKCWCSQWHIKTNEHYFTTYRTISNTNLLQPTP